MAALPDATPWGIISALAEGWPAENA